MILLTIARRYWAHNLVLIIRLSVVGVVLTVCIWILVCYLIIIFTTLISTLYVYIYIFIYICSVFWKESPLFPSTTFSPITFLVCCTRYTRILTRYSVTTPNPVASWVLVKYNVCSLFSEELFDRRNTWGYIFVNQTKIQVSCYKHL